LFNYKILHYFEIKDPADRVRVAQFLDHVIENFQYHLTTSAAIGNNQLDWKARLETFQNVKIALLGTDPEELGIT